MINQYFIIRLCEYGYLQKQDDLIVVINPRFEWSIDFAQHFTTYDSALIYLEKLPIGRYQIEKIIEKI